MAANADRASIEGIQSIHTTKQSGLTSAGRPQQADSLTFFDIQRDSIENGFAVDPLGELRDRDEVLRRQGLLSG